jgi:hypothetical protein
VLQWYQIPSILGLQLVWAVLVSEAVRSMATMLVVVNRLIGGVLAVDLGGFGGVGGGGLRIIFVVPGESKYPFDLESVNRFGLVISA